MLQAHHVSGGKLLKETPSPARDDTYILGGGLYLAHSFVVSLHHCVFSTKERQRLLSAQIRPTMFSYINGIAANCDIDILGLNGVEDHVHVLLGLNSTTSISKAMQLVKTNSSKWARETVPELKRFNWQEGYGAFSIGISQVDATLRYIAGQEQRHRRVTFEEEYRQFLEKHKIQWVPDEALG